MIPCGYPVTCRQGVFNQVIRKGGYIPFLCNESFLWFVHVHAQQAAFALHRPDVSSGIPTQLQHKQGLVGVRLFIVACGYIPVHEHSVGRIPHDIFFGANPDAVVAAGNYTFYFLVDHSLVR